MPVQCLAQCTLYLSCCWKSIIQMWSQLLKKKTNPNPQHILRAKLKEKKSKDLNITVYLLMFSCALKIISKHHVFRCALISCGLFNYSALLMTLPQNISIILQVWTRLCILPSWTWGYYLAYFAVQETESQNFAPDKGCINKRLGLETAKHPHKCCPGTLVLVRFTSIPMLKRSSTPLATKPLLYATSVCSSPGLFP